MARRSRPALADATRIMMVIRETLLRGDTETKLRFRLR